MNKAIALPHVRKSTKAKPVILIVLGWLLRLLKFLLGIFFAVFTRYVEAGPAHPHYSGNFGDTTHVLGSYDSITPIEHDAAGEFMNVWME